MNYFIKITLLCCTLVCYKTAQPLSMVYNFRIAQITKQPIFNRTDKKKSTAIGLFFDQYNKKYNGTYQNFYGGLGSFIYDYHNWYFRFDTAGSKIFESANDKVTYSGAQTDDVLFTIGRNFELNQSSVITLSGLFGFPTHPITRFKHAEFGYSQIGTGIQLDGLYEFNKKHGIIVGGRYIYFVPRNAQDNLCKEYKFTLGNIVDILCAFTTRWPKHGLEFGYTARWRFGAHICPYLEDAVEKSNYVRNNFYGVYKYKFLINQIPNRLLFNLSYGFDSKPKEFGNRFIVTLWTSWNVNF